MTQDSLIILCLKIGVISGFVSLVTWVAVYSYLAQWWHHPLGRTLVVKSLLIAALLVPTALALFLHLSGRGSRIVAWADVVLIGAIAPTMTWRIWVWLKLDRTGKHEGPR